MPSQCRVQLNKDMVFNFIACILIYKKITVLIVYVTCRLNKVLIMETLYIRILEVLKS